MTVVSTGGLDRSSPDASDSCPAWHHRRRPDQCGGGGVQRGAGVGSGRGLRPDVLGAGEVPRLPPPGRAGAPPGPFFTRSTGRSSLESWTAERFGRSAPSGSGLCPCCAARPGTSLTSSLRCAGPRSPSTSPGHWPTSPAPRLSWPGHPVRLGSRSEDGRFLRFSTPSAPSAPSCPPMPTPRPRPISMPSSSPGPPPPAPVSSWPTSPGRPRRGRRRGERPGRRARARRPDRCRDHRAHRL